MSQVSFENGLAVVSSARKLIIRVPKGTPVNYPAGANISKYGQAFLAKTDPVIVVHNATDKSMGEGGTWQGADGEHGIVILNEVPEPVANELLDMIAYCQKQPGGLNVQDLKTILDRAIALGKNDQYTTDIAFVDAEMSSAGRMIDSYTGIVKRTNRDVSLVARDSEGVIRLRLPKGEERHIEPEILQRTYVLADGSPIDLDAIPTV